MNTDNYREFGAVLLALQGVVTALAPQLSSKMIRRMVGRNFENADQLEAKPAYLRQLRAIGVGMAAAGVVEVALRRAHRGTGTDNTDIAETGDESNTDIAEAGDESNTDIAETDDESNTDIAETDDGNGD